MPQEPEIILTPASRARLEAELVEMRTVKRNEIKEAIQKAREYGDLSENFEYAAARREQAILNGRIAEVEAVLARAVMVADEPGEADVVGLGCMVTLQEEEEEEWEIVITDTHSADPLQDRISCTSPLGKALLRRGVGEVVEVETPGGLRTYTVIRVAQSA